MVRSVKDLRGHLLNFFLRRKMLKESGQAQTPGWLTCLSVCVCVCGGGLWGRGRIHKTTAVSVFLRLSLLPVLFLYLILKL